MTTDRAHFALTLPSKTDFTDTTITLRIARQRGAGGSILAYLQAGGPSSADTNVSGAAISWLGP